jgi:hypothetical protein
MEQNDLVLNSLNEFVEKNKVRISEIKIENPPLHTAVLDALVFLNKRFGNVDVTKSDIIEEKPAEIPTQEEVEVEVSKTYEPAVGDIFYHKFDKEQLYVVSNKSASEDELTISWLDKKNNEETSINEGVSHTKGLFEKGTYVLVDRGVNIDRFLNKNAKITPKFNAGDRFSTPSLDLFAEIISISNDNVEYVIHDISDGSDSNYSSTVRYINDQIDRGDWVKYTNINAVLSQQTKPIITPTPTPTKKPRAKNPNQARIKEIKEAIEGLAILAEFGDTDAQKEIDALNTELQSLK